MSHFLTPSRSSELMRMLTMQLPIELVYLILEFAAQSSLRTALAVLLVNRRVHRLTLPHFYRHVALPWASTYRQFLQLAKEKRSIATFPRSLWMNCDIADTQAIRLCPNLTHLAVEPRTLIEYCHKGTDDGAGFLPTPREIFLLSYPCDWSLLDIGQGSTAKVLGAIESLWLSNPSQMFLPPHHSQVIPAFSGLRRLAINFDPSLLKEVLLDAQGNARSVTSALETVKFLLEDFPSLEMVVIVFSVEIGFNPHTMDLGIGSRLANRLYTCMRARHLLLHRLLSIAQDLSALDKRVYIVTLPKSSSDSASTEDSIMSLFHASALPGGEFGRSIWQRAKDCRAELTLRVPL